MSQRLSKIATLVIVCLFIGAGIAASCSKDDNAGPAGATTTNLLDVGGTYGSGPLQDCTARSPMQVIPEAEAIIRFGPTAACPSYANVLVGTTVTFHNNDTVAHTVTLLKGYVTGTNELAPPPSGSTTTIAPGQTLSVPASGEVKQRFDEAGTITWTNDAIKEYRGVIQVVTPEEASHIN